MCDCITKVNELMVKERKVRVLTTTDLTTGVSRVSIPTEAIAGAKKPKFHLLPKYCPFCGESYPDVSLIPTNKGETE